MDGEKWNLDLKLTSQILYRLKLIKMARNSDFECQIFDHFSVNEELQNNELDPDVNYFLDKIILLALNTMYLMRSRTI